LKLGLVLRPPSWGSFGLSIYETRVGAPRRIQSITRRDETSFL
jgi:hypothetical protein